MHLSIEQHNSQRWGESWEPLVTAAPNCLQWPVQTKQPKKAEHCYFNEYMNRTFEGHRFKDSCRQMLLHNVTAIPEAWDCTTSNWWTFVLSLKTLKHTRICTSTSCNYVLRKSKRYQWFSYLLHRQQLIFKQFWIGTRAKLLEGGMKGFKKWWYSWHECWHLASYTCLVCSSSCPDAPEGRLKAVTAGNKSWQQATAVGEQQKC